MPFAISLSDLRNQIAARLPGDARLPTLSTIRYNFWPPNPSQKSALNYTGRFKVKLAVQQKLFHASHDDKRYGAHQFSLLKEMAVKWRDHSRMICLDDKAIVHQLGNQIIQFPQVCLLITDLLHYMELHFLHWTTTSMFVELCPLFCSM